MNSEELLDKLEATDCRSRQQSEGLPLGPRTQIGGIKFYQSENWGDLDSIVDYYFGPNHLTMSGFQRLPYTFTVEKDGTICMFNDLTAMATPVPQEPYIAVLVAGCFSINGEQERLGVETGEPTEAQLKSIKRLCDVFGPTGKISGEQIGNTIEHFLKERLS